MLNVLIVKKSCWLHTCVYVFTFHIQPCVIFSILMCVCESRDGGQSNCMRKCFRSEVWCSTSGSTPSFKCVKWEKTSVHLDFFFFFFSFSGRNSGHRHPTRVHDVSAGVLSWHQQTHLPLPHPSPPTVWNTHHKRFINCINYPTHTEKSPIFFITFYFVVSQSL